MDDSSSVSIIFGLLIIAMQGLFAVGMYFRGKADKHSAETTKVYREVLLEKVADVTTKISILNRKVEDLEKKFELLPYVYVRAEDCARYRKEGQCKLQEK